MKKHNTEKLLIQIGAILSTLGGVFLIFIGLLMVPISLITPHIGAFIPVFACFYLVLGLLVLAASIYSLANLKILEKDDKNAIKNYAIANIVIGATLASVIMLIGGILLFVNNKDEEQ